MSSKLSGLPTETTFGLTDLLVKVKASAAGDVIVTLAKLLAAMPVKLGTLTVPASTGNLSVTGLGFTPRLVRFTYLPTSNTTSAVGAYGVMTAAGQFTTAWFAESAGYSRYSDPSAHAIAINTVASTTPIASASFVSMDSGGFTINFDNVVSGLIIGYEALA